MNIQQLRYVVAIANNGTFREAASKLFVSQPSLSVSIKDLEAELGFQIFNRTTSGTVLTSQGLVFMKALEVVKSFDSLKKPFLKLIWIKMNFLLLANIMTFCHLLLQLFSQQYDGHRVFRIFESTTIQILDEVAQGNSEIGIIYLNVDNQKASFSGWISWAWNMFL